MKITFTRIFLFSFLLVGFVSLNAQEVNTLTVNTPVDIAGDYRIVTAPGWGMELTTTLTGDATFVDDGTDTLTDACDDAIANVDSKIAFIDRGNCEFSLKALNAQNGNAIVAVICNNVDDGTYPSLGAGSVADMVNIPVIGMTFEDCQTIRAFAEGADINVTFSLQCSGNYGPEVVWGTEPGQGDFAGGLNDWTVVCEGDTCWGWTDQVDILGNGSFATNPNTGNPVEIATTTICNGAIVFDSDRHDNLGGGAAAIGTGICPSVCTGAVISPEIDLSGLSLDGLYLEFEQQTRQFDSEYQVLVSNDGGATYKDTIIINDEKERNSAHFNETIRVPLPGYENENSIRFQFRYLADYYYWIIDDVRLVNEASADMNLRTDFYSVAPTYRTPVNQVVPIPFLIDIDNLGNVTAEGVEVTVDIFNEGGDNVFSYTNTNYADQPANEFLNENSVFDMQYTPTEVGTYIGRYTITSTTPDADLSNNEVFFQFEVTENILSPLPTEEDFGATYEGIFTGSRFIDPTDDFFIPNYATGYIFYLPNGDGQTLSNVRFGIHELPTDVQANVDVYLFQFLYSDEDESGAFTISAEENSMEMIGVNTSTILAFGGAVRVGASQVPDVRMIDIPMGQAGPDGLPVLDNNNETVPIELANNRNYVLVIACRSDDGLPLNLLGTDPEAGELPRSFRHGATNLANDTLGMPVLVGGFMENIEASTGPTEIMDLVIDNGLSGIGGTAGNFGVLYDFRVLFTEMTIEEKPNSNENINFEQNISVFPNPTSDRLVIDLDLEATSETVNIELVDVAGRKAFSQNYNNIRRQTLTVNVSDLTNGVYTLNIRTKDGLKAEKVVIQH